MLIKNLTSKTQTLQTRDRNLYSIIDIPRYQTVEVPAGVVVTNLQELMESSRVAPCSETPCVSTPVSQITSAVEGDNVQDPPATNITQEDNENKDLTSDAPDAQETEGEQENEDDKTNDDSTPPVDDETKDNEEEQEAPAIAEAETPVADEFICNLCGAEFGSARGLATHKNKAHANEE